MTKNTVNKLRKYVYIPPKMPNVKKSYVFSALLLSGLLYAGYRMYSYKKYKSHHYIDIFELKQQAAADVRRADLWAKVKGLSVRANREEATNNYEKNIKQAMERVVDSIKHKCAHDDFDEGNSNRKHKSKPKPQ